MHLIISRTDSIGDVVLTLPMAGVLKERLKDCQITFIGRSYTEPIVALSEHVDRFMNWDEIEKLPREQQIEKLSTLHADGIIHVYPNKIIAKAAKLAGIPLRIGTSHRTFHWTTCNRRVSFSRKKSNLHEAQLNFKLLLPLGIKIPDLKDIQHYYGFTRIPTLSEKLNKLIDPTKKSIVLHPKSKGSAREWGLSNFKQLIDLLPPDEYKLFITGTQPEADQMKDFLEETKDKVYDVTGQFTLEEYIAFLGCVSAIVAASTGPLHIAAALGKHAIGIFPPIRPMHPGRWAPLGQNAHVMVKDRLCAVCRKTNYCKCMNEIPAQEVVNLIQLKI